MRVLDRRLVYRYDISEFFRIARGSRVPEARS